MIRVLSLTLEPSVVNTSKTAACMQFVVCRSRNLRVDSESESDSMEARTIVFLGIVFLALLLFLRHWGIVVQMILTTSKHSMSLVLNWEMIRNPHWTWTIFAQKCFYCNTCHRMQDGGISLCDRWTDQCRRESVEGVSKLLRTQFSLKLFRNVALWLHRGTDWDSSVRCGPIFTLVNSIDEQD